MPVRPAAGRGSPSAWSWRASRSRTNDSVSPIGTTASTCGNRSRSRSPSLPTRQPVTATVRSGVFHRRSSCSFEKALSSEAWRTTHVLMIATSARSSSGSSVNPAARSWRARCSESAMFIWQPTVHTWKLRLMVSTLPQAGDPDLVLLSDFDQEADAGPLLPIDGDVDEGGHTHDVDAAGRHVTARDRDRLDRLIDGAGADRLYLDTRVAADHARDRAGHRHRLRGC